MYHGLIGKRSGPAQRPGGPYNVSMLKSRLVPWLGFGGRAGGRVVAVARRAGAAPPTSPPPTASWGRRGRRRDRAIVDFRDDVSASTLANNGFEEIPISDYSRDRLYRIDFAAAGEAAAARAKLAQDPSVESVDFDALASIPPGEELVRRGARRGHGAMEADAARRRRRASGFPNDPASSTSGTCARSACPTPGSCGHGKGVVVAVIDTGVTKVARPGRRPSSSPATTSSTTTPTPTTTTATARTWPGTIAQATHNGSASPASPGADDHAAQGAVGARLGLGRRHRRRHPLRRRRRRQGHQHEPGRPVPDRRRSKGGQVRARQGRRGRRAPPATTAAARSATRPPTPASIAVAATQFDETTTFYSNWGKEIDVAAPGGNTRVDQNGDGMPDGVLQNTIVVGDPPKSDYFGFMGTSMASPHAAGVAALVVGAGVTKPDAVEKILLGTAREPKGSASKAARESTTTTAPASSTRARPLRKARTAAARASWAWRARRAARARADCAAAAAGSEAGARRSRPRCSRARPACSSCPRCSRGWRRPDGGLGAVVRLRRRRRPARSARLLRQPAVLQRRAAAGG